MSPGSASVPAARFRGTSTPRPCSRRAPCSSSACGTSWPVPAAGPDTSSTWGTACCPRRRSKRCRRWWSGCMAAERVAVLLMAYGGPASLEEVAPSLLDVRGGRPTPPHLIPEIKSRYAQMGGRSPIREHTEAQAAAVAREFGGGERFSVYVGMRHWHPYIKDTVERIVAAGHRRVVGIVLAPHYSAMSVGAYGQRLAEAAAVAGLAGLAEWGFAYQGAGATSEPWLGPEAGAVMTQLAAKGHQAFL